VNHGSLVFTPPRPCAGQVRSEGLELTAGSSPRWERMSHNEPWRSNERADRGLCLPARDAGVRDGKVDLGSARREPCPLRCVNESRDPLRELASAELHHGLRRLEHRLPNRGAARSSELSAGVDGHDGRLHTTEPRENVRQNEPTELAVHRLVGTAMARSALAIAAASEPRRYKATDATP
jgi:hypothetical protein